MKKILLFGFLVYCSKSFALNLSQITGCYKTIQINGITPNSGPILGRNQSRSENFPARTYTTIEAKKPIDINVLSFFLGYEAPYYSYSPVIFLKGQADKEISEIDYYYYEVDKDIYMNDDYSSKKVDHYVKAEFKKVGTQIDGHITFISNQRRINRSYDFTLQKEDCIEYAD